MPPKRTPPATERVLPYDLRKTRIPRVVPSSQPDQPAGNYVPTAASKRIKNMKKGALQRGYPTTLPPMARQIRKEARQEARGGRQRQAAATSHKNVSGSKNAATKSVRFAQAADEEVISSDPVFPLPSSDPSSPSNSSKSASDIGEEEEEEEDEDEEDLEAEEAAVQELYHSKERLKKIVHTNRVKAARRELEEAREAPLDTSELEDEIEDRMKHTGDYAISVSIIFRLNKKRVLTKSLADTTRYTFDILAFEEVFLASIEPFLGDCDFEFVTRTAVIKHASGRGGSRRHDFDDFTLTEADHILEIAD
ncbi:uncharacterized protein KD926_009462 [Aspergillus affinis]|uniref:uncharacterized protein n=1 Tax=Aspergillus affinis TaxID=1070780 RepID=UPI0022FF261E|nr:uncharacterized protein KD926_009462 [Aspergillus affinis]KAI9039448.1 hypothetical protein KD926_009462 [Aspergillus affinis]